MGKAIYRRVVIKVSGEALSGPEPFGLHQPTVERIANDLAHVCAQGVSTAVVIGGGNFVRGIDVSARGVSRPVGDSMGMLATVINALALEAALMRANVATRTLSALAMPSVCEAFSLRRALDDLDAGRLVLLAAGTGNPFFTTDTAAVLRAAELGADCVLKATNVDGVYSTDPKRDPGARRFERLSHDDAIAKGLKVMDATAFALARENGMPIIVFSIREPGALTEVLAGKGRATIVGG